MRAWLFIFIGIFSFHSFGQQIIGGEYFYDKDLGVGSGTYFSVSPNTTISETINASTTGLSAGFHDLFIRLKDNTGRWSHYEKRTFYSLAASTLPPNMTSGEWFIDNDPGVGNGTAFSLPQTPTSSATFNVPTSSLSLGFHTLYVRVKDINGKWSHYEGSYFYILDNSSSSSIITAGEWFIDSDPGVGHGTSFTATNGINSVSNISIPSSSMTPGFHTLFTRVKDNKGIWSHYEGSYFYILDNGSSSSIITAGEWFIDNDPGVGHGTSFAATNGINSVSNISIPSSSMTPGFHTLFTRVKDNKGNWSHYEGQYFYILSPAVASNIKFIKAEYFFDSDPGVGNGTSFVVPNQSTISNLPLSINTTGLPDGDHTVSVRFLDDTGKWSHLETRSIYICGDLIGMPSYSGNTTFCQGQQININGIPVNNISTAYWTGPNNFYLQSTVLVRNNASPSMSGTYRFNVVSQGGYHCDTNYVSVNVTVNPSYNNYQQKTICYGDTLHVGNQKYTTTGFFTTTLQTTLGCDSVISTSLNVIPQNKRTQTIQLCTGQTYTIGNHTYTTNGTYYDTLVSFKGCDSIVITNLSIGNPILNTQVTYLDSTLISSASGVTYQWLDCNNNLAPIPGETSSSFYVTQNGKYAVQLTSISCPGVTAISDCIEVNYLGLSSSTIFDLVKLYPNPNNGYFYIETEEYNAITYEITDLQGRLLQTSLLTAEKTTLDIHSFAAGTYLVRLIKGEINNVYKVTKE